SFLPVFALGGMEGKMFRPLAFTKSFALLAVAVLAITLVPALCSIFIRGRLRGEMDSWVVRGVVSAYRPLLSFFLAPSLALACFVGVPFIVGGAPVGSRFWTLAALCAALIGCVITARRWQTALVAMASTVLISLIADQHIKPLGREFMIPLD